MTCPFFSTRCKLVSAGCVCFSVLERCCLYLCVRGPRGGGKVTHVILASAKPASLPVCALLISIRYLAGVTGADCGGGGIVHLKFSPDGVAAAAAAFAKLPSPPLLPRKACVANEIDNQHLSEPLPPPPPPVPSPPFSFLVLLFHAPPSRPPPQLRNEDSQEALAELSASKYMHLVASMDHVNAPLMWDARLSEKFNWAYHKAHTYKPYVEEVSALSDLRGRLDRITPSYPCLSCAFLRNQSLLYHKTVYARGAILHTFSNSRSRYVPKSLFRWPLCTPLD